MSEQDQTLIDPALQAEDEAYKSSLGGIYPSQGRTGNNNDSSSSGVLEDEGYGARSHPTPGRAGDGPASKKKRTSAVAGDEEGRKKSRQSRESPDTLLMSVSTNR